MIFSNYEIIIIALPLIGSAIIIICYLAIKKPLYLFGLMLIQLQFMPVAPKKITGMEVAFLILGAITFLSTFLHFLIRKQYYKVTLVDLPLVMFLIWLVTSYLVAKINNVVFGDWFRQIAPFVALGFYYVLRNNIHSIKEVKLLTNFLLGAGFVNILIIIFTLVLKTPSLVPAKLFLIRLEFGESVFGPILFALEGYLVGFLTVADPEKKPRWYFILLVCALVSHLFLFSRSVLINYLFLFIAFLWLKIGRQARKTDLLANIAKVLVVVGVAAIAIYINFQSVIDIYVFRLTSLSGTEKRIVEIKTVWRETLDSYLLGKGLGAKLKFVKEGEIKVKPYTHNFFTYIIVTLGVPGLLLIIWLIRNTFLLVKSISPKIIDIEMKSICYGYVVGLLSVMIYIQLEAVYRHIIFFLLISLSLSVLSNLYIWVQHRS